MEFVLVRNIVDERLNYYKRKRESNGKVNIYRFIGFKNKLPVYDVMKPKTETEDNNTANVTDKIEKQNSVENLPSITKVDKLIDKNGLKFIKLNGKLLKVVSHKDLPAEIRKSGFTLKPDQLSTSKAINIENLKKPLNLQLAIGKSLDRFKRGVGKFDLTETDKQIIRDNKHNKNVQIKYITRLKQNSDNFRFRTENILINPLQQSKVLDSTNNKSNIICIVPIDKQKITEKKIHTDQKKSTRKNKKTEEENSDTVLLLPTKEEAKLLTENNIKILNKMKMQAINLSMKSEPKLTVDCAVQTISTYTQINLSENSNNETNEKSELIDKTVQTSIEVNDKLGEDKSIQTDEILNSGNTDNSLSFLTDEFSQWLDDPSTYTPISGESQNLEKSNIEACTTSTMNQLSSNSIDVEKNSTAVEQNKELNSEDIMHRKKIGFFYDLRECADVDFRGNLFIHVGVLNNDIGLVKRMATAMKARGIDINVENHDGCTPLQLAIISSCPDNDSVIRILLDYGADIVEIDGDGNNILHLAAKYQKQKALKIILTHVQRKGNRKDILNSFNFEGLTPLMICCISKWFAGVELLLKNGTDLNIRDHTSGRTALFHAAESQCIEIVRLLLDYGANPKIKNFFGTSPHDAMYDLDDIPELIKYLILGKSKKRGNTEDLNPPRTTKIPKILTYSKLQRIDKRLILPASITIETDD